VRKERYGGLDFGTCFPKLREEENDWGMFWRRKKQSTEGRRSQENLSFSLLSSTTSRPQAPLAVETAAPLDCCPRGCDFPMPRCATPAALSSTLPPSAIQSDLEHPRRPLVAHLYGGQLQRQGLPLASDVRAGQGPSLAWVGANEMLWPKGPNIHGWIPWSSLSAQERISGTLNQRNNRARCISNFPRRHSRLRT